MSACFVFQCVLLITFTQNAGVSCFWSVYVHVLRSATLTVTVRDGEVRVKKIRKSKFRVVLVLILWLVVK